jgi:hypothetical protein
MNSSAAQDREITLALIEGGLTVIVFAASFLLPRLGSAWFARTERVFAPLAQRKRWSVVFVGITAFVLRLAILPVCPVPLPFVPDDFSFLLAADTFAHGRLTNPTPAMWTHFETIHVTMQPTYMSMYFPGQGLLFAASKVLLGHPWYGLLVTSALMCAAICWMLQAWLPPSWALLGGLLAILRLGLFSFWINTYTGAGLISSLGGALALGALPRLMRTASMRHGSLLALGIALLVLTRPYEGTLLCLPVAVVLGRWAVFGKNRPTPCVLIQRAALPLALVLSVIAWLGFYDYRAFGNPLTLPYTVDRAAYAVAPYFVWQPVRHAPAYRHEVLRSFYTNPSDGEVEYFNKIHSVSGYLPESLKKVWSVFVFFAGGALLVPLIMVRHVFLDRRIRFLVVCVLVLIPGMAIQIYVLPHYLAPFTAAFYAIGLQAMRHLRAWRPEGKFVGTMLVRLAVTLCIVTAGLRLCAEPLHIRLDEWPPPKWNWVWYGPGHFGTERAIVESGLERLPGTHLAIVRYAQGHQVLDEWVYNAADIDHSKIIWAREMDAANNLELIRYYHDRQVWLVEPDAIPARVVLYPAPERLNTVTLEAHPAGKDFRERGHE